MYVDFSRRQKRYITFKLPNSIKIDVEEPNMQIIAEAQDAQESNSMHDLVRVIRHILNRNRQKKIFKAEEISAMFSLSDLTFLLEQYVQFAKGIQNDPN